MREEIHTCLCAQPGHWFGQVTRLGLLGSAQTHGPNWTQPKKMSKIVSFLVYLFCSFVCMYVCVCVCV